MATAISNPPPVSNDGVSLPAVTLSGVMSTVGIQPAASGASKALAIDGNQWVPLCANHAGIVSGENQSAFAVDNACLGDLSVFEVSNVVLDNAEAKSKFHAVFTADQVKSGNAAVTVLTELAYAQVHLLLAARRPATEIMAKLDAVASWLLINDLNNDGTIDYEDLIGWRPTDGEAGLRIRLSKINNLYLTQTDPGLAALEAVNAISLGAMGSDSNGIPLSVDSISGVGNALFYVLSNGSIAATDLNGTSLWSTTLTDATNTVAVTALKVSSDYLAAAGCTTVQSVTTCTKLYVASTPATGIPEFDKVLDLGAKIQSIYLNGDRALVATASGLLEVDIATMSVITSDDAAAEHAAVNILTATDAYIYALTGNTLTIVDRITFESVASLTFEHNFSEVSDALLLNNHLVVAAGLAGILNFDVTDPTRPVEGNTIISTTSSEKITSLKLVNDNIIALGSSGVQSFTIGEAGELKSAARLFVRDVYPNGGMAAAGGALFFSMSNGNSIATAPANFLDANPIDIAQLPILGASTMAQKRTMHFL